MRILVSALVLSAVTGAAVQAQSRGPGDAVKQLFDAMRAQDTVAMRSTFHADMRLLATGAGPDGAPRSQVVPLSAWLRGIAGAPASTDERLFDTEVRTDGGLATVWTRYDFFVGDRFSHCGYDAFQLVQQNGEWKIIAGADTQRRDPARCGRGTAPVSEAVPTAADTAAVLSPIRQLFAGMEKWDTVAIKSTFTPDARTTTVAPDGTVRSAPATDFYRTDRSGGEPLRERMFDPEVRISDNLATVWTFYDFHLGSRFSHCGIDYAQLVRTADGWKIAQLSWTMRREGCERVTK